MSCESTASIAAAAGLVDQPTMPAELVVASVPQAPAPSAKKYQCGACMKCFKGPDYLQKHMKKAHNAGAPPGVTPSPPPLAATMQTQQGVTPPPPPAAIMQTQPTATMQTQHLPPPPPLAATMQTQPDLTPPPAPAATVQAQPSLTTPPPLAASMQTQPGVTLPPPPVAATMQTQPTLTLPTPLAATMQTQPTLTPSPPLAATMQTHPCLTPPPPPAARMQTQPGSTPPTLPSSVTPPASQSQAASPAPADVAAATTPRTTPPLVPITKAPPGVAPPPLPPTVTPAAVLSQVAPPVPPQATQVAAVATCQQTMPAEPPSVPILESGRGTSTDVDLVTPGASTEVAPTATDTHSVPPAPIGVPVPEPGRQTSTDEDAVMPGGATAVLPTATDQQSLPAALDGVSLPEPSLETNDDGDTSMLGTATEVAPTAIDEQNVPPVLIEVSIPTPSHETSSDVDTVMLGMATEAVTNQQNPDLIGVPDAEPGHEAGKACVRPKLVVGVEATPAAEDGVLTTQAAATELMQVGSEELADHTPAEADAADGATVLEREGASPQGSKKKSPSTSPSPSKSPSQSTKGGKHRRRRRVRRSRRCSRSRSRSSSNSSKQSAPDILKAAASTVLKSCKASARQGRSHSASTGQHGQQRVRNSAGDWQSSRSLARQDATSRGKRKGARRHSSNSVSRSVKRRRPDTCQPSYKRTNCWHGFECTRRDCWFAHPNGRRIDDTGLGLRRDKRNRNHSRSLSPSRKRRDERSRKHSSSPSASRTRRRDERSRHHSRSPSHWKARAKSASQANSPVSAGSEASSPAQSEVETLSPCSVASRASNRKVKNSKSATGETSQVSKPNVLSFRNFALHHLDDSVTPQEAISKFSEFKQKLCQHALELLKESGSGLLFDLYNPLSLHRQYTSRVQSVQNSASDFVVDLAKERFSGLQLVATDGPITRGTCQTAGHFQAPHFAFDPNVNALVLSTMPGSISAWKMNELLQSQPGFLAISSPQRPKQGLTRELRARFQSEDQVHAAVRALNNAPGNLQFEEAAPAKVLEAFVLPPEMSHPDRLAKDMELSKRVICKLDAIMSVPLEKTHELLDWEASVMEKVDVQVMYLRRVHHFCFYGCTWCSDEWALYRNCGAALLRGNFNAENEDGEITEEKVDAGGEWAEAHDQRIENFIDTASFEQPSLPSPEEEPLKSRLLAGFAEKTTQVSAEKHQCGLCGKCFKTPEHVHKHLKKVHHTICDEALHQVCAEIADTAYLADSARPGWPPSVDMASGLAAEGGA